MGCYCLRERIGEGGTGPRCVQVLDLLQIVKVAEPAAAVRTMERVAGPFAVGGRTFRVALPVKQLLTGGTLDPDFTETVSGVQIRDEAGRVQFQRTLSYRVWNDRFEETTANHAVSAEGDLASQTSGNTTNTTWDEKAGVPLHAVIEKDSVIEFVEAEAALQWEESEGQVELGVSEDIWLKLRIDGKEGWIHSQEDFQAAGWPQAG